MIGEVNPQRNSELILRPSESREYRGKIERPSDLPFELDLEVGGSDRPSDMKKRGDVPFIRDMPKPNK